MAKQDNDPLAEPIKGSLILGTMIGGIRLTESAEVLLTPGSKITEHVRIPTTEGTKDPELTFLTSCSGEGFGKLKITIEPGTHLIKHPLIVLFNKGTLVQTKIAGTWTSMVLSEPTKFTLAEKGFYRAYDPT